MSDLDRFFDKVHSVLETAYLAHEEPWRQSGMSGPEERWVSLRRPVADCMDRSGALLDIGCANGYLLECCLRWTAERGVRIEPHGLDISDKLAALARKRLPDYADHIYVGNGYDWAPPRRFDYVRTELCYVPAEAERAYVERLLREFLLPGGRLLVANYMEGDPRPERGVLPENHPTRYILDRLLQLGLCPVGYRDGYDPIKDRHVRVAILDATSIP